jgi:heat shock protein HslJ
VVKRQVVVGAAVAFALTACGSATPTASGRGDVGWGILAGRAFVSTDVTTDGGPFPLAPGSVVWLSFEENRLSARAGCNTMGAAAGLDGDVLVVEGGLSMTEMACDEPLMEQDAWLADLLSGAPVVAIDGDQLTLTTQTYRVALVDEKTVNPDLPLEGTTWTLTGVVSGSGDTGSVSTVPRGVTATIRLKDGSLTADAGCNRQWGAYTTEGDRITVARLASTNNACPGPSGGVEKALSTVLRGSMRFTIDGDRLSLVNGPAGLYLTAE